VAQQFQTVDAYISSFPTEVQLILEEIRQTIRTAVPGAEETIRYQMPTIAVDGKSLVHFAAWKSHIGLYPLPQVDDATEAELAPYNTGRGTARFPLGQPIPYPLIQRLATLLVDQRVRSRD
jgi:uncharacterized protein YdhG (YjbR/CyaY superfamily)